MASFTGVGDNVELNLPARGESVAVALSGTYNMIIELQREQGAPGSGSWVPIKRFSTEDATEAFTYVTARENETVRLIVLVDNSGTATATLTDDSDLTVAVIKDARGNTILEAKQSGLDLTGALRGLAPVDVTAATVAVTAKDHAGRVITLNRAAGVTATLPAATGTGNKYRFFVGTTVSSNDNIVQAASASDSFGGGVAISTDIAGVVMLCAATTDTCTMNGTTTGGVIGSWVEFTDVASGKWMVDGFLVSTGSEATPWSAAV